MVEATCPGPLYGGQVTEYGQFCPVAKAAEVLCSRWAILVVRELLCGSSRFGEISRGLPGCPPATLSKRLRELERAGVVERSGNGPDVRYELTEAGWELYPLVEGFGRWGQRWVRSNYGDEELDAEVLMWDVRRYLRPDGLGVDRLVLRLDVRSAQRDTQRFWIVVEPESVDLCMVDPGRPVEAVVSADLAALTKVWMGDTSMTEAMDRGDVDFAGPQVPARRFADWFGRHPVLAEFGPATSTQPR